MGNSIKKMTTYQWIRLCLLIVTCIVTLLTSSTTIGMPEQKQRSGKVAPQNDNQTIEDPEIREFLLFGGKDSFVYKREGRADPFMPFVKPQLVKAAIGPFEELTGMRKFEPGQLSLVSIVFTEKDPLAMVQDSTGKGYILRQGMKIGRSGIVDGIVSNVVIIKQAYTSPTGKKRHKILEMVLRKEGEERL